MASLPIDQVSQKLNATQEDLQVMVNYAKALLKENTALHALLKTVVIPLEEDLETLNYLSELGHEMPTLKTDVALSTSERDHRTKGIRSHDQPIRSHDQPISPRAAARMSFWPEAVSSADEDLKAVLKEKMALKEEVMCLMDEVEVLKVALKRAGSELNSLKSERANREAMSAVRIPSIMADVPSGSTEPFVADMPPTGGPTVLPGGLHPPPLQANARALSPAVIIPPGAQTRCVSAYIDTTSTETTPTKSLAPNKSVARSVSYKSIVKQVMTVDSYITAVSAVDYRPQESQDVYVYIIHVTWTDGYAYELYRRYGEFFTFSNALRNLLGNDSTQQTLPSLPAVGRPGHPVRSVKAHLASITIFCELVALQMAPKVSRSLLVTDFFKAYPRDKNLGCITTPVQSQKNATDPEHGAARDQTAEVSAHLEVADGDTPSEVQAATEDYVGDDAMKIMDLAKGDLVVVIEKSEDGWWLVAKGNTTGWAPSTYLELMTPKQENALEEDLQRRPPAGEYIAEQPHTAVLEDELSFPKDATLNILEKSLNGWWLARYDGKVGLVPASLLVKKLGKRVPRKTCVTLRSNFGHNISGIPNPPPRRLLDANTGGLSSEKRVGENGGVDTSGGVDISGGVDNHRDGNNHTTA